MELIKDLIELSKKNDSIFPYQDLCGDDLYSSEKGKILMKAILEGEVKSDVQGIKLLFAENQDNAYRKTKFRLKEDLLSYFSGINLRAVRKAGTTYHKRIYLRAKLQVMVLLQRNGLHIGGVKLAHKICEEAALLDDKLAEVEALEYISYYYCQKKIDGKKLRKCHEKLKQAIGEFYSIQKGILIYRESIMPLTKILSPSEETIENLYVSAQQIQELDENDSSDQLKFWYNILLSHYYLFKKSFHKQQNIALEAAEYFRKTGYRNGHAEGTFLKHALEGLIHLRHFDKGEDLYRRGCKVTSPNSLSRFNLDSCYVVLLMHQKDFLTAAELLEKLAEQLNKQLHSSARRAFIFLLIGYAHVAIKVFHKGEEFNLPRIKAFKPGIYENYQTDFKTDKAGMHLSFLLLRNLFRIVNDEKEKVIKDMEAFDRYLRRYELTVNDFKLAKFYELKKKYFKSHAMRKKLKEQVDIDCEELRNISGRNYSGGLFYEIVPLEIQWKIYIEYA